VDDAKKVMMKYRVRFLNEPDNREALARELKLFTMTLPADIRKAAKQAMNKDPDNSLEEGLANQVEKAKAEKERMQSVGSTN
jgi:hypothetical protein